MDNTSGVKTAILLYLLLVGCLIYLRPSFLFTEDGDIKKYGNRNNQTMTPLWLIMGVLALISYIFVLIYVV